MSNNKEDIKLSGQSVDKSDDASVTNVRRKALKSLLVSGGVVTGASILPQKWSRPVVDSVILPSHASTTDDSDSGSTEETTVNYYYNDNSLVQNRTGSENRLFAERILDAVVPTAQAVQLPHTIYICIAITGNTYKARVIRHVPPGLRLADYDGLEGTIGVAKSLPTPDWRCSSSGGTTGTILVNTVTTGSCYCEITDSHTTERTEVLQGDCAKPNFDCGG